MIVRFSCGCIGIRSQSTNHVILKHHSTEKWSMKIDSDGHLNRLSHRPCSVQQIHSIVTTINQYIHDGQVMQDVIYKRTKERKL